MRLFATLLVLIMVACFLAESQCKTKLPKIKIDTNKLNKDIKKLEKNIKSTANKAEDDIKDGLKNLDKEALKINKKIGNETKHFQKKIDQTRDKIIEKEEKKVIDKVKQDMKNKTTDVITENLLDNQVDREDVNQAVKQVPEAIQGIKAEIANYTKNFTLDEENLSKLSSNSTDSSIQAVAHTTVDFVDEFKQAEAKKLKNQNTTEFDIMKIDKDAQDVLTDLQEHYNQNDQ